MTNIQDLILYMREKGFFPNPKDIHNAVPDQEYRYPTKDKPNHKNGWVRVYHNYNTNSIGASFGDYRTGKKFNWSSSMLEGATNYKNLINTSDNNKIKKEQIERKKMKREQLQAEFDNCALLDSNISHQYLTTKFKEQEDQAIFNKKIQYIDPLKINDKGNLVIPFRNIDNGFIGYQEITGDGRKYNHGSVHGNFYLLAETDKYNLAENHNSYLHTITNTEWLFLVEGLSTMLTCAWVLRLNWSNNSKYCCAVSFGANNLEPVLLSIWNKNKDIKVVLIADNDFKNEKNTGFDTCNTILQNYKDKHHIQLYLPDKKFITDISVDINKLDMNDLHYHCGYHAVVSDFKQQISEYQPQHKNLNNTNSNIEPVIMQENHASVDDDAIAVDAVKIIDADIRDNISSADFCNPDNVNNSIQDKQVLIAQLISLIPEIDFIAEFEATATKTALANHKSSGNLTRLGKDMYARMIVSKMLKIANDNNIHIKKQVIEKSTIKDMRISYIFNSKHWEKLSLLELQDLLSSCAEQTQYGKDDSHLSSFKIRLCTEFYAHEECEVMTDLDHSNTLINLQNTIIEVTQTSVEYHKHHHKYNFMYVMPYSYIPNAKADKFLDFLEFVLPDPETRIILQEFIGYIFIKNLRLEKFLILLGDGGNGKSAFFFIIEALIGIGNISNYSIQQLAKSECQADLADKLLNYSTELNKKMDNADFKKLISNEPVMARYLYGNNQKINIFTKFIFNANYLPSDSEDTEAWYRRCLIIDFNVNVKKKLESTGQKLNRNLAKEIIDTELSGVLNWAIEGIKRLQKQKEFSTCKRSEELLLNYKKTSNPVSMFLDDENIFFDKNNNPLPRVQWQPTYDRFVEYCRNNGDNFIKKNEFNDRMKNLGYIKYTFNGTYHFKNKRDQ